jgi:6-phosphogluconolactonase
MKFTKFGKALLVSAISIGVLGISSCVQSYTVGFLYVTNLVTAQPSGNGNISGFKIDHNTGQLRPIDGLPISSGGANPVRATLVTGSRFLYVLNRGVNSSGGAVCTTADPCHNSNITQFAVGGNGILTPQETFYTQGINPFRIISDSAGNYLFVLDHDSKSDAACKLALGAAATTCGDITVFEINQTTGRLHLVLNSQVALPGGQALSYFPVPADPIDFVITSGYLLALSGTPATGDFVFPYTYNSGSGQLTVNQNSAQPLDIAAATAIVVGGGNVFVLDNEPIEVGGRVASQSQIIPFSVGTNGFLQTETGGAFPDDPTQANPIYLLVESKSKWLYVANQGNNNTTTGDAASGITGYIINTPPQYSEMPGLPFGTGSGPQCLVEDPSDQFIYTANFNDSTVTGKALDENAGTLGALRKGSSFSVNGPATWCLVNGRTS